MQKWIFGTAAVIVLLTFLVWWSNMAAPPLAVSWRPSLVGSGPVLQLKKGGKETVFDITVYYQDERRGQVKFLVAASLSPDESTEIGGFGSNYAFTPGGFVTIGARGYFSLSSRVQP